MLETPLHLVSYTPLVMPLLHSQALVYPKCGSSLYACRLVALGKCLEVIGISDALNAMLDPWLLSLIFMM